MKKRIVMSGYYGFRNAGDDAVCQAIIQALQEECPDTTLCVLSNDPLLSQRTYGVMAVNRWQPFRVFRALLGAKVLVSGGGSLIQDVTSKRGCWYYLGIILMAALMRKKVIIYSQGLGPLNQSLNRHLTGFAFNRAKAIYVRDAESAQLCQEIGVKKVVEVVPDPVLGLHFEDSGKGLRVLERCGWRKEKPLALVALREWPEVDCVADFALALDEIASQGYEIGLLSMHKGVDTAISKAVAGHMHERAFVIDEDMDTESLFGVFAQSSLVLGMRLHSLIIAAALRKRLMAISYDPKVEAFMKMIENPCCLALSDVNAENLKRLTNQAFDFDLSKQNKKVEHLKQRCLEPAKACKRNIHGK